MRRRRERSHNRPELRRPFYYYNFAQFRTVRRIVGGHPTVKIKLFSVPVNNTGV